MYHCSREVIAGLRVFFRNSRATAKAAANVQVYYLVAMHECARFNTISQCGILLLTVGKVPVSFPRNKDLPSFHSQLKGTYINALQPLVSVGKGPMCWKGAGYSPTLALRSKVILLNVFQHVIRYPYPSRYLLVVHLLCCCLGVTLGHLDDCG